MAVLYVASSEPGVGKTAICAGLGRRLLDDGRKVGYIRLGGADDGGADDAAFVGRALGLKESDCICLANAEPDSVKDACSKISSEKDLVVLEGDAGEGALKAAEAIGAKIVVITGYAGGLSAAIDSYKAMGDKLLGVVVNKVPAGMPEKVIGELSASLDEAGVNLLGLLPEDRVLLAMTVGEMAQSLGGKILNDEEGAGELVENLMVGAMSVDHGPEYFGRKSNKAVVVRVKRPDIQLAALETSTRCLVLTGGAEPARPVRHKAQDKKVPIISVGEDTATVLTGIEQALGKTRFNQDKKMSCMSKLLEKQLNFQALYKGLGLAG